MTGLYIASTMPQAGKSLFSFSLGSLLQEKGFAVGYIKPFGNNPKLVDGIPVDADAFVAQEILGQKTSPEYISPFILPTNVHTLSMIDENPEPSHLETLTEAYQNVSHNKNITLVCGTNTFPYTGKVYNADALQMVKALQLKVVFIEKYTESNTYDALLSMKELLKEHFIGAVLNNVPEPALRDVHNFLVPFLQKHQIPVHGVIPHSKDLQGLRISDIAHGLAGCIITGNSSASMLVEGFIIGTMQVGNFMSYVKKHPKRLVIVEGDRTDLQLAALLAGCPSLILTGNRAPTDLVRKKAENMQVPLITVKENTFATATAMAKLLEKRKIRDLQQIKQAIELVKNNFSFETFLPTLGV